MVVVALSHSLGGIKGTLQGSGGGHYTLQQKVLCLRSRLPAAVESSRDA